MAQIGIFYTSMQSRDDQCGQRKMCLPYLFITLKLESHYKTLHKNYVNKIICKKMN